MPEENKASLKAALHLPKEIISAAEESRTMRCNPKAMLGSERFQAEEGGVEEADDIGSFQVS